ncbi:hypothetical protein [Pacificibacter marinus]|uniref:Porin n=1 Tax=Pacificibacter marinus TaxID=658057 RepID=A0A1Y5TIZ8_9RHOB|nr:hypothetical protein [Pacificibacter marinus]SEL24257.1 hypothetical protein SAMN04488032_11521 [Pacificibacter marinus]SLN65447.1 hypothetical protein PAM7971_03443 [Pacificibacter marinus]
MTNFSLFLAFLALIVSTPAVAQDSSFQLTGAIGAWSNQYGGHDFDARRGIDGEYERTSADIGLSYARTLGNGMTGVAAVDFGYISPAKIGSVQDEDATKSTAGLTLRLLQDQGDFSYGGFIGGGTLNDYGDTNEKMTFGYIGAEMSKATTFGSYYGQIGYLDSSDEFDEGTREAPFINLGGSYNLPSNYALTGALGLAGGNKYLGSENNQIISLSLGVERAIGDYLFSVGYEATQISFDNVSGDGNTYGDTFGTLFVGVTYEFGGKTNHGSRLPSLAKWVSYNANEIEQPL